MDYQQLINNLQSNIQNLSGAHVWLFIAVTVFIVFAILTLITFRQFNRHPNSYEQEENLDVEDAEVALIDVHQCTGTEQYRITKTPMMIGRLKANGREYDSLVIPQSTVGRRHAVIRYEKGAYWIQDQGSVNGSYVNGERIEKNHRLTDGDHLKFHKFSFQFVEQLSEDFDRTMLDITLPKMTRVSDSDQVVRPNDVLLNQAKQSNNVIEIKQQLTEPEEQYRSDKIFSKEDLPAEVANLKVDDNDPSDREIRKNIQDMTVQLFKSPDDDKTMRLYAADLDGPPEIRPDYEDQNASQNSKSESTFLKEPLLPDMDENVVKALGDFFDESNDDSSSQSPNLKLTTKGDRLAEMGRFSSRLISRKNEETKKS
ncbi:MAG: FHA domain-containing protein [Gammaproteobacteria bacterium]